jgi:HPt (histidine-containing phosphotransfer) domain-containing protein
VIVSPTETVSLADLPVLDEKRLMDEFGNDPAVLTELRDLFRQHVPPLLDAIRSAYEASDCRAIARAAHSLKGAAATYGAMRLSAVGRMVEMLAKDGCLPELDEDIKLLTSELAEVLERIAYDDDAPGDVPGWC